MTDELNIKLSVSTGVATWFLFHPDDLAHRRRDPHNWWTEDFAISKELAAGRLIAVRTGKDGNAVVRFTNRGLTEREQTHTTKSAEFRLQVQYDRLYLDGGNYLPSEYQMDPEDCYSSDYGWITLPNGNYRATVHAIAWFQEPDAMDENGYSTPHALTSYVVDIQPVASLEVINPPACAPALDPIIYKYEDSDLSEVDWLTDEDDIEPLASQYPLLHWHEVIFPGVEQTLDLRLEPFEVINRQVVISYAIEVQAIAILFEVNHMPSLYINYFWYGFLWGGEQDDSMTGVGKQLIRLNRVFERDEIWWAEVEPYEPPIAPATQGEIDRLKQLFADYAEKDVTYQKRIRFHRFYAERVASLTKARELGWFIAHAIDLSGEQQQALLPLSDAKLVEELTHTLETRLGE